MKKHFYLLSFLIFTFSYICPINKQQLTINNLNSWTTPLYKKNIKIDRKNFKNKIPLFKKFPDLEKKVSYVSLGQFPTPIKKLNKLGQKLGIKNLYLKNDGISSKPFGGNKIRKLEFLLADALYNKAKTIITAGDAGSNHALATISCAKKLGLKTISMLTPQLNTNYLRRNLLLSLYYGGQIKYFNSGMQRNKAIINLFLKEKQQTGQFPYFIPIGGSTPLGILGFINAAFELKEQIIKGIMPEPDYIYITLGSAGSAVGLSLGLKLAQIKSKLIAVRVSGTPIQKNNLFKNRFIQTANFIHSLDKSCKYISYNPKDIYIENNFAGKQYAQITIQAAKAIKILNQEENIKLDGTYTGKTFSALLNHIKNPKMKNKTILFWNTFCSGNYSNITKRINYKKLPRALHKYFEKNVQILDQGC